MMKDLSVVTGAGSGMGLEIARLFGKKGPVLICGRTAAKIQSAVSTLKMEGIDAAGMVCDVSDPASVRELSDRAAALGNVRYVINAAGVPPAGNDAKTVFGINLLGTVHITEAFFSLLGPGGVLINIGSLAGYLSPGDESLTKLFSELRGGELVEALLKRSDHAGYAYSISKKYVSEYTRQCCSMFAQKGARVVCITPGTFETPLFDATKHSPVAMEMLEKTPMGRIGDPVEIAYLAEFLASDRAGYITGTDVVIDGGYLSSVTTRQLDS